MITTIRAQFKQTTYRYIVFFIVLMIALGMISLPSLIKNEKAGTSWVSKVNSRKISYQDFAREVAERSEWLAHIRSQYGQYTDFLLQAMNISTDPKALALEMLINEELITQCAKSLGIQLYPNYIAECIHNQHFAQQNLGNLVPPFVFDQSGALNEDKLKLFLQHKGLSIDLFENKVENALVRLNGMHFVASSSYTPLFDSKQEFIKTKLGKQFAHLTFSFDQFIAEEKKHSVSNEDLLAFYTRENSLRRRYWVPEERVGIKYQFDAKNYGAPISDAEINEYYDDHKVSDYVIDPIKVEVRQITEKQAQAFSNLSFEELREELINNPLPEWDDKWELLKPFARGGEKKGSFEREAFTLQNQGDISSVIETKDGKVIIQLVRRIPRTYKPLVLVKNEIKNILAEKQFKKSFVKDMKAVAFSDDSKAIETFIAQKSAKKEFVDGLQKNDTRLSQELFSLKKGEYAFFVEGKIGFAVQLTDIKERHLPDFESIKDVVKGDFIEELAHNKMIEKVQHVKDTAATGVSFEELQKTFGGSLYYTNMIEPNDNNKIQELDKKGLPSRAMLNLDKVGAMFVHNGERVSILIKLTGIESYDEKTLSDAQTEVKNQLDHMRIKLQLESFVASLHRNATIETNESILIAGEEYSE